MKRISWPVKIEIVPPCLVFAPPNTAAAVHVRQYLHSCPVGYGNFHDLRALQIPCYTQWNGKSVNTHSIKNKIGREGSSQMLARTRGTCVGMRMRVLDRPSTPTSTPSSSGGVLLRTYYLPQTTQTTHPPSYPPS